MDGTSGDHLVQPILLKQFHPEPAAQHYVQKAFQYPNSLSMEKGLGNSEVRNNFIPTYKAS